jgi:Ca2+-binding EF-hand superfamily protein
MFQRFEILAKVPWNNDVPQDAPCLLLTPRPVTKEHNRSGSRYAPTSSLSSRKRGVSPPPQDPFSKSVIGADLLSGRASAPPMCGFSREDMYLKQRAADLASFVSPLATAGSSSMRRDRGSSPPSPISAPSPAPLSAQSSNLASVRHGLKDVSSRMHPHPAALKTSEDHVVQKPKERDRPWRTPKGAAPTITREESNFDLWLMQNGRRKEPEVEVKQTKQEASEFLKSMTSSVGIMKPKANVIRDIAEVRRIFGQFDEDQSGLLEPHEFVDLLARLMRLPKNSMDMDQVWRHWEAVDIDGGGTITFDEFQKWYCGAFSIEHPDFRDFFTKDIDLEEDDIMVRNVAKKLHMCVTDIEKLWKTFTRLDSNKSGKLEFEEFKELIEKQLKPELSRFSTTAEVPSTIYKKFWVELDPLGSGSVAFPDFAAWYVSFFKDDEVSPMERYYNLLAKRPGHHG